MTDSIENLDGDTENGGTNRRAFLTRGAVGAAAAVVGGAALVAMEATPAFAAIGAGNFITPVRVFDSRTGNAQLGEATQGIFTRGDGPRAVIFGTSGLFGTDIIPQNALGAIITCTITQTAASGALAVTASASATTVSNINWFATSQTLANSMVVPTSLYVEPVKLFGNDRAQIFIHVVGGAVGVAKTHCIIDCSGYIAGS